MRLVAIRQAHRLAGHDLRADHPAIRDVLQGIRRAHGTAPTKKEAAVTEIVRDAVRELAKAGDGLRSRRDRALLHQRIEQARPLVAKNVGAGETAIAADHD